MGSSVVPMVPTGQSAVGTGLTVNGELEPMIFTDHQGPETGGCTEPTRSAVERWKILRKQVLGNVRRKEAVRTQITDMINELRLQAANATTAHEKSNFQCGKIKRDTLGKITKRQVDTLLYNPAPRNSPPDQDPSHRDIITSHVAHSIVQRCPKPGSRHKREVRSYTSDSGEGFTIYINWNELSILTTRVIVVPLLDIITIKVGQSGTGEDMRAHVTLTIDAIYDPVQKRLDRWTGTLTELVLVTGCMNEAKRLHDNICTLSKAKVMAMTDTERMHAMSKINTFVQILNLPVVAHLPAGQLGDVFGCVEDLKTKIDGVCGLEKQATTGMKGRFSKFVSGSR